MFPERIVWTLLIALTLKAQNRAFTFPNDPVVMSAQAAKDTITATADDQQASVVGSGRMSHESSDIARADTDHTVAVG